MSQAPSVFRQKNAGRNRETMESLVVLHNIYGEHNIVLPCDTKSQDHLSLPPFFKNAGIARSITVP